MSIILKTLFSLSILLHEISNWGFSLMGCLTCLEYILIYIYIKHRIYNNLIKYNKSYKFKTLLKKGKNLRKTRIFCKGFVIWILRICLIFIIFSFFPNYFSFIGFSLSFIAICFNYYGSTSGISNSPQINLILLASATRQLIYINNFLLNNFFC